VQKYFIKRTFAILFGLFLAVTLIGGLISGCNQAAEKETKTEKKEEKKTSEDESKVEDSNLSVSSDWLEKHLSDKDIKVIDIRAEGEYNGGHIPGAVNLPIEKTVDAGNPIQGMVVPKDQIETLLSDLGISNSSKVVVYEAGGTPFGGRVFWILKYYGQKNVSLLDGGIKKWQKEGKKLKWDLPEIKKTAYKAKANPGVNATKSQVLKWVNEKSDDVVIVDTRPQVEWDTGHIPGAVRLDWMELLTTDDPPVLKSSEELQKLFEDNGITKDKEVVLY